MLLRRSAIRSGYDGSGADGASDCAIGPDCVIAPDCMTTPDCAIAADCATEPDCAIDCDLELLIIQMDEGIGFGLPTDVCGILATLAAIRDQLQPSALKILQ